MCLHVHMQTHIHMHMHMRIFYTYVYTYLLIFVYSFLVAVCTYAYTLMIAYQPFMLQPITILARIIWRKHRHVTFILLPVVQALMLMFVFMYMCVGHI